MPFGKDINLAGICYVFALCYTLLKKEKNFLCWHLVALWERYWHTWVLLYGFTLIPGLLHTFEEGKEIFCWHLVALWGRYFPTWGFLCGLTLLHTVEEGKEFSLLALGFPLGKILAYLGVVIWFHTDTGTVTYF